MIHGATGPIGDGGDFRPVLGGVDSWAVNPLSAFGFRRDHSPETGVLMDVWPPLVAGRPDHRRRTRFAPGALGLMAMLLSAGLALSGLGATAPALGATSSKPILAADYFGEASPINFWGSDLSNAGAAFAQMKADGFNTVGLVLPWGYFEPGVTPIRFNKRAFSQLDSLISLAQSQQLGVILRLGYDWDVSPTDQLGWGQRYELLGSNESVDQAWVSYISEVHQNVAKFSNVRLGYLSWEDFWLPVEEAQPLSSSSQRIQLASATGYRQWLSSAYSLTQVEALYKARFASWSAVPTPLYSSPSFRLMYQFDDWLLVHKVFDPAAKQFPRLDLEARVDVDPIYSGSEVVGSYSHADTYRLPGTEFSGMYFAPYMGDPSSSRHETASDALTGLQSTLTHMSSQSGGKPLFIFEFEIVSNTPVVASDPSLSPTQVNSFVAQSEPALHQYTAGYALFTYRDFNLSPVFNPSFSMGLSGWTSHGHVTSGAQPDGSSYVSLGQGTWLSQTIPPGRLTLSGSDPVTVSLQAMAPAGSAAIGLQLGDGPAQTVTAGPTWQTLSVSVPQDDLSTGKLVIDAGGPVSITDVQVYGFTQQSDLYTASSTPESGVPYMRALNQTLAAADG